jgi:hypothetical protein
MNFDKRTLYRLLGGFVIFVGLVSLVTGKVIDTTQENDTRYRRRPLRVISKAEDPTMFYMEVIVTLGLGALALYHASREE